MNAERNEAVRNLRRQGMGPREIARRLNLSPSTVSGILHRAGMTSEPSGRGHGAEPAYRLQVVRRALATSINRAAAEYGHSRNTVYLWAKEARSA